MTPDESIDRWREHCRVLLEHMPDIVTVVDRSSTVWYVNRTLPPFQPEAIVGTVATDYLAAAHRDAFRAAVHDVLETGREATVDIVSVGGESWQSRLAPFDHDSPRHYVVVISTRTTERRRMRDELSESETALRRLTRRIVEERERERLEIARDLHDQLGQELTALKLQLSTLDSLVDDRARPTLHMAMQQVDASVEATRQAAMRLQPRLLDTLGLRAAVEGLVHRFEQTSGVRCSLRVRMADGDIEPGVARVVVQVIQEALTNVARHAAATFVRVLVYVSAAEVALRVRDDGRGLPGTGVPRDSVGVSGMRERVESVGGRFQILGPPGTGTRVVASIPRRRPS